MKPPSGDEGSPAWVHASHLVYFYTFFQSPEFQYDIALCTPESVARLFKAGVDVGVAMLTSQTFVGTCQGEKPLAVLVDRSKDLKTELAKIGRADDLQSGVFVDVVRRKLEAW